MIVGILNETNPLETRVAATPETSLRMTKQGITVMIEQSAGIPSGFTDNDYIISGALIKSNAISILRQSDVLLKITSLSMTEAQYLKSKTTIIGNLHNLENSKVFLKLQSSNTTCFNLEKLPRISRAQPFDTLSSQNSLSGYQAVIYAAHLSKKIFPLMITSAGTVAPLKILIIGIGIAGLQAIATAKRLGAKVYAYDIRKDVQEQIKSLNAIFVSDLKSIIQEADIIITSAFSPTKQAPIIIDKNIIKNLKPTTILIDLAAEHGGNVEGSQNFKLIKTHNCLIYGNSNFAAEIPTTASSLFANNLANFLDYISTPDHSSLAPDFNDIIISETCILRGQ